MARPSKYNWDAIKEAYEGGFDRDEICKKYKISKKQLSNKINEHKWVVKGHIKPELIELSDKVHKTSENVLKLHPENQELALNTFDTKLQDQELMTNNRKIGKLLQSVIIQNRNNIDLKNIKNVSGVIKDIESIANPKPDIHIDQRLSSEQNTQNTIEGYSVETIS